MWTIEIKTDLMPHQRQRTSIVKGRMINYLPKETRHCMDLLAYRYKFFMSDKVMIQKGIPIKVLCDLHVSRNSGDIDNYFKTASDPGNKILWHDDKQITEMHMKLHRKSKDPKIILTVIPLQDTLFETEA